MVNIGKIWTAITSPLGILDEWAREPLKRWEHARNEESKDRDVERHIREQIGVEEVRARLQSELDENRASLEIRMQTEINRLNAETEQWIKDKEFERMHKVADAIAQYQERLTDLNLRTVRAIGEMDIELRSKAQSLILEKTKQYRDIQDKASKDAIAEFELIEEKFSGNERVKNIMISNSEKKLVSLIDATTKFLQELNTDIQNMNGNIDRLIQMGHEHTLKQLDKFNAVAHPVRNKLIVEDVTYKELPDE